MTQRCGHYKEANVILGYSIRMTGSNISTLPYGVQFCILHFKEGEVDIPERICFSEEANKNDLVFPKMKGRMKWVCLAWIARHIPCFSNITGYYMEESRDLFSAAAGSKTRSNGLTLQKDRFH